MIIKDAQYMIGPLDNSVVMIKATVDGKETFIPTVNGNRHYQEILKQVNAGTLTIKDAD
jgi:hypothetical protein